MECPAKERLGVRSRMPGRERKEPGRTEIKKEVVSRELSIDMESESELSSYQSVPSIHVSAKIKERLLQALINCGAEGDIISEKIIKEKNLPTLPIQPMQVGQALAKASKMTVDRKVQSHIHLPTKEWTSKKPADLLVAPLANSDIVLGMLFLKQEKITVDANRDNIILPIPLPDPEPAIIIQTSPINGATPLNKTQMTSAKIPNFQTPYDQETSCCN